ncbi:hypothetical protein NKT34_30100 [Paenibacillus polysaccharolyticus]|uniref:hypothetical protein n=1 Tax=Paenibacillus polysaccharolyticus TaxID=582692 RepID=UPI00209D05D1|nr:hypothetical protein [Paenibacillus polysaccharolyticus]MCP1137515.1 hypothetical protein [Paenibacillus polysaccharolyticus]
MSMRTGRIICFVTLMFVLLLVGCSKQGNKEASADVESADALALTYIQASVEFNDDLFKSILFSDQPRYANLKAGKHSKPGNFEKIGDQYSIYRYSEEPNEQGDLYYKVSYFLDNHQKYFSDLLKMSKEDGQWKIREINEEQMMKNANPDEVITIHKSDGEG